ncbi:uncharacterized protein G2W53_004121 [Senna tora]|uniref:Uncharacterized protein n=1 Tax=Senna tora TaxID=362788 RepID=A0A834XA08_9FABA|nr:uncharacterized protein G2W53_004121 [Senna tora]
MDLVVGAHRKESCGGSPVEYRTTTKTMENEAFGKERS